MARRSRTSAAIVAGLLLFALAAAPVVDAISLTDLPTLSSSAAATSSGKTSSASAKTTSGSSVKSTKSGSSATTTGSSASTITGSSSSGSSSSFDTTGGSSASTSVFHLSELPTLAGVGIPTLVIPYTAAAPFMQKSSLPEGTVFICVGAILGFLGFCVVAWRAMVACTINRSVKKAAMASMLASDTKSGWMSNTIKPSGGFYSAAPDGSALSLDALTPGGKPKSTFRGSKVIPSDGSGLFYSPTASQGPGPTPMTGLPGNRSSTYLPAGYYASPAAQAGGGASNTTLGSQLNPSYQGRPKSMADADTEYSGRRPRGNSQARLSATQHSASRDGNRRSPSRPRSMLNPSALYAQASSSSLAVGTGIADDSSSTGRAPSAYLEDLFDNHGNGPRERY